MSKISETAAAKDKEKLQASQAKASCYAGDSEEFLMMIAGLAGATCINNAAFLSCIHPVLKTHQDPNSASAREAWPLIDHMGSQ